MAKTILGKVGMTPKGAYNNSTEYVRLDVVTKNGQSYVCLKDCSGTDVTNTTHWQLIAQKGEMPVNGVDYNTTEQKQEFKEAVVADSKAEMDNYTTEKKDELDTYTVDKKSELDTYKTDLEEEMSTTKDNLVKDINTTATENIEEFNNNVETKTNTFNDNATTQTNNFNSNVESKTTDFNNNVQTKLNEYNSNSTTKLEEYNTNATNKVAEFNDNVDSLENELTELASQMPWNTTEVANSIHIEDSAKYSRNKLGLFGNLYQEKLSGKNKIATDYSFWESGHYNTNGIKNTYNSRCRTKDLYPVLPNTTYYVNLNTDESLGYRSMIRGYDSDKNFVEDIGVILNEITFTTSENTYYISFTIGNTDTATPIDYEPLFANGTIKPFICLNSETDKSFEIYTGGEATPNVEYPSMPVVATGVQRITKCESNLYDVRDKKEINTAYSLDDNDWLTITVDNSNGTSSKYLNVYTHVSKKLKTNTKYFLVTEIKSVTGTGTLLSTSRTATNNVGQFYTGVTYKLAELKNNDIKIAEIVTLEDFSSCGTMLRTFTSFDPGNSGSITFRLSLLEVEPTIETFEYKPYTEETFSLDLGTTELCKIVDNNGNVLAQDKIIYKDNKWQFEKKVDKVVFDGTENWTNQTAYKGFYRYMTDVVRNNLCANIGSIAGINSHFTQRINQGHSGYEYLYIQSTTTTGCIYIQSKDLSSLADFKAFLAEQFNKNTSVTTYYVATVFTYEDCTDEQSEVLDKLHKLTLQQGTNNIYVESENGVTTELQLTYMQDNNMRINNMQEQINALSEAIINIGGNE